LGISSGKGQPVHERLNFERTSWRIKIENIHDRLETEIADQLIVEYGWQENQWCPSGLTRSQKRRVQHLRNDELHQNRHKVWQVKQTVDKGKCKAPVEVFAIFMLLAEFRANSDEEELDEEKAMAQ
jgi:hypothetical protein